jgi:hypothetical protein
MKYGFLPNSVLHKAVRSFVYDVEPSLSESLSESLVSIVTPYRLDTCFAANPGLFGSFEILELGGVEFAGIGGIGTGSWLYTSGLKGVNFILGRRGDEDGRLRGESIDAACPCSSDVFDDIGLGESKLCNATSPDGIEVSRVSS